MGSSSSKHEKDDALRLCGERLWFIKQAIDSRYALSAAHLAYITSLRNVGAALRQFAEAEISTESSLSASDPDESPSHSPYASPSPSTIVNTVVSPADVNCTASSHLSNLSFMRSTGTSAVTVQMDSSMNHFFDEESLRVPIQPPPPPPGFSSRWDYFEPSDSTRNVGSQCRFGLSNSADLRKSMEEEVEILDEIEHRWEKIHPVVEGKKGELSSHLTGISANGMRLVSHDASQKPIFNVEKIEIEKEVPVKGEDPSEFITHRAKDFLSSMRDIENRFLRAAEYGQEVSRMLEASKIRLVSSFDTTGRVPSNAFSPVIRIQCCRRGTVLDQESSQQVARVITWTRSVSSMSSSSRNPLGKYENCDSGSDFAEEFCMISGSHSSTLDRLYAWERKLYDEVKASESIRKRYDRKCVLLRRQCARDLNSKVIDKTRAVIKDLHSQIRVAIVSVDLISKRIEKVRDDELLPQFMELIQALIRMWKQMLECHHMQYITISLAYHGKRSSALRQNDTYGKVISHLQDEIEVFNSSFTMWIESQRTYVEAINSWLQNCILQPQELHRGRKVAFSPRRAIAPPIFVLCRDWLAGIDSLPSEELSNSIRNVASALRACSDQQVKEKPVEGLKELQNSDMGNNKNEKLEKNSHLGSLQASVTKNFSSLSKFAEESVKVYEEIKESSEKARIAYVRGRIRFLT